MAHRFHGKESGKNKVEKRLLKLGEEIKQTKMSSTDTPLGMVERLAEHTKTQGSAFLSLSKGKSLKEPIIEPKLVVAPTPVKVAPVVQVVDMDKALPAENESAPREKIAFGFSMAPKRKAELALERPAKKI